MSGQIPHSIWLYMLIHIDNLPTFLKRGRLHTVNPQPDFHFTFGKSARMVPISTNDQSEKKP